MRISRRLGALTLLLLGLVMGMPLARAAEPLKVLGSVAAADWASYMQHFVDVSGRVVDDANGNISHSEGQGYGMLLAFAADDHAGFERIWSFTQTALLLRDDGLAVWRWQPETPHVPDTNNASDGDILIAYALALAGNAWQEPRYVRSATTIAHALASNVVIKDGKTTLLLPGVEGFGRTQRADGPVINLSYWVFEALPWMAKLAPAGDWDGLSQTGIALAKTARFGTYGLPTDWISVHDQTVRPADQFHAEFGYNAIRIPLYMLRAGIDDPLLYAPFVKAWGAGGVGLGVVDIATNRISAPWVEPGYRVLAATLACVASKTPIPADLKSFAPTQYFPSTLQLLSLSFLKERHSECL